MIQNRGLIFDFQVTLFSVLQSIEKFTMFYQVHRLDTGQAPCQTCQVAFLDHFLSYKEMN